MKTLNVGIPFTLAFLCSLLLALFSSWPVQAQTELPDPDTEAPELPEHLPEEEPPGEDDPPEIDEPDDEPGDQEPLNFNPPPHIQTLAERTGATEEQITQLRQDGYGWGNIKIALSLAERIAAAGGEELSFEDALSEVTALRGEGQGWGQIAGAKGVKVGDAVKANGRDIPDEPEDPSDDLETDEPDIPEPDQVQEAAQKDKGWVRSLFDRKSKDRPGKKGIETGVHAHKAAKPDKPVKVDKPERVQRIEKPERIEKINKPEKPERPGRPQKPEKPERPGNGRGR